MNKWVQACRKRWNGMGSKDRNAVLALLGLALSALLWWGLMRPFFALWHSYPALALAQQHQLQSMQENATALVTLRNAPSSRAQQSQAWLESQSKKWLGDVVRVQFQAETATVQIDGNTPEQIAQWLQAARLEAHALPRTVQWQQVQTDGQLAWQGSVVLQLPEAKP